MVFTQLITKYRRQAQNHTAWVLTSLLHFQWQIMRPLLFQTKWSCLLPSMSAASGEASDKMAEFQSGQYKLWHCQLMAEVWSWGDFHRAMSLFFYDAIPDNPSYGYATVSWWLCSTPRDERNVLWSDWFSLVNCLLCCLELVFRICRSRWALPPCSTSTLARELPPLPLPSVWGRSASREDLTGLKRFFWKSTLGVVQLFTLWSWLFQFCWLPVGVTQQGEALEGHQGEIREPGRGGLNTKWSIT